MNSFAIKVLTAPLGHTYLFYVGQAGYIIKSRNGQLLGIDMYLTECGERLEGHMGFKRLLPKILDPFDLVFDILIATHPHFDHFDMDAIPQLMSNHKTKLFASTECKKEVERLKMNHQNCTYVAPDDSVYAGDFSLSFVHCDHGSLAPDAFGVVIKVDGRKIYMAGDTCKRMDRVNYINEYGPFDIVVGPINGAYGNMNEEDYAEYASSLNTDAIIPCHYGLFAWHGGNPGKFLQIMQQDHMDKKVYLMAMGEKIQIS